MFMFSLLLIVAATFPGGFTENPPNDFYSNHSLWLVEQEKGHYSDPTLYQTGSQTKDFAQVAIASDAPKCAKIARDILKTSGATIAEATIAALVCYGAVNQGYSGIGGGLQLVHYSAKDKTASVLVSRETAPDAATEDMFSNDPGKAERGGLGVAVPGEVKGFMELYKRFGGKVPWADLFKPTINMLRGSRGEDDDRFNQRLIKQGLVNHPTIRCDQWNATQDCSMYKSISQRRNSQLADTLQKIADSKGTAFYDPNNQLCQSIAADIKDAGGIITTSDLAKFTAIWVTPVTAQIDALTMLTSPPPSGGALVAFIMRVLAAKKIKSPNVESHQYLVEAMKHAFGTRPKLGDPVDPRFTQMVNDAVKDLSISKEYLDAKLKKISASETSQDRNYYMDGGEGSVPPDHGTAAFAIVGANGDAIVLTTTLNFYGGAGFSGRRTGIIFNNQMQDFSYKRKRGEEVPSVANGIRPGKRPLSSASPSVFVDKNGKVRLVAAGIGGVLIPGAVTSVVMNNLYFGKSVRDSLDASRLYHLLGPMEVNYEYDFNRQIIQGLQTIGHQVKARPSNYPGTACVAIARTQKGLTAGFDWRKEGSLDGF